MASTHFVYVADVYCPWCFAFAPIMERISYEHPEFPVRVIGGNLISQPITLEEDARRQPGLVDFWHEVENTSGRSLAGAIRAVQNREPARLHSPSADEILAVLRHLAPNHELEQLLMLEDMVYGDGVDLFTPQSIAKIANRWNIPETKFERALNTSAAQEATERDLELAGRLMGEITSYPSVLLVRGNRVDAVSRGYAHYETVISRLQWAMRDLDVVSDDNNFCSLQGSCTLGKNKTH